MSLGGTTVHENERTVQEAGFFGEQVPLSAKWVSANELEGKVSNPSLEFVAAVCRLGKTNRMYRAIKPQHFIGLTGDGSSVSANRCMKYVVARLNGVGFEQASKEFLSGGSMCVVDPTRPDF